MTVNNASDWLIHNLGTVNIYIAMVSAQLPSNKTKSRPLTVAHSHVSSLNLSAVFCSSSVNKFIMSGPISDANEGTSKDINA